MHVGLLRVEGEFLVSGEVQWLGQQSAVCTQKCQRMVISQK